MPPQGDDPNRRSFSQERDTKKRPIAANRLTGPIRVFWIDQNVGDMNDFAFKQDAPRYRSTVDPSRVTCDELGVVTRKPVARFEVESFTFRSTYDHRVRLAQAGGRVDESIEHRLEIEGRTADNLEHLGGRGLLLQRFPQLVQQPRVLDRDDGLAREACNQCNLLVRKWANFLAIDGDRAEKLAFLEHRYGEKRARPGQFHHGHA